MSDEEEWQVVTQGKKRRGTKAARPKGKGPRKHPDYLDGLDSYIRFPWDPLDAPRMQTILKKSQLWAEAIEAISRLKKEAEREDKVAQNGWRNPKEAQKKMGEETALASPKVSLVCLGIGPLKSGSSIWQFVFATLVAANWQVVDVQWSDPRMTDRDIEIGDGFGFQAVPTNTIENSLPKSGVVIALMPHCDRWLYERVITTWVATSAHQLIIIGNSFEKYTLSTSSPTRPDEGDASLHPRLNLLVDVAPFVDEAPLPRFPLFDTAFNDMAVISLQLKNFQSAVDAATPLPTLSPIVEGVA
eukprot:Platyproteum_vivax@DN3984_c0_g1_i1.p1